MYTIKDAYEKFKDTLNISDDMFQKTYQLIQFFKDKKSIQKVFGNNDWYNMDTKEILIALKDYHKFELNKFIVGSEDDTFIKELKSADDKYCWAVNLLISVEISIVEGTKSVRVSKEKNDKIFQWLNKIIERGQQEGDFSTVKNSKELTAMIIYIMKGMAYIRMKLGYKKFISPDVSIIMDMVL